MELMLGNWRALLDLADRYEAVTAEDVQRVAAATFAPHRRNVVTLVPGDQPEEDSEDQVAPAGAEAAADAQASAGAP
jgi:predicted Zn-dependent peptidase